MKIFFTIFFLILMMTSKVFAANGEIETTLYLNEKIYDQFFMMSKTIKIPAEEWNKWLEKSTKKDEHNRPLIKFSEDWTVRLHIKNNSDEVFKPLLKIIFGANWGDNIETIKNLTPPLNPNESIDFKINLSDYEFVGVDNTSVYLQIRIDKKNFSLNENYYCIWFDLE